MSSRKIHQVKGRPPEAGGDLWEGIAIDGEEQVAPDVMLPEQFRQLWHETRAIAPERKLLLAMLWQAIFDLSKYRFSKRHYAQRLYMEAYRWVAADHRKWAFSFVHLCQVLDINVHEARTALLDLGRSETASRVHRPSEVQQAA